MGSWFGQLSVVDGAIVLQLAALVVMVPIFWASSSAALATFGAESMMPVMLGPTARVAGVLLVALLAGNVAVYRAGRSGEA